MRAAIVENSGMRATKPLLHGEITSSTSMPLPLPLRFRSSRSLPLPEHVASVTAISSSTPEDGLESLRQSLGFNLIFRRLLPTQIHEDAFFVLF